MSGGIHIDFEAVGAAASGLDTAADGVDGTAGTAPAGVDAGDATYIVSNFLADFTSSAGELVVGLKAAAQGVRDNLQDHRDTDQRAGENLQHPGVPR